MKFTTAVIISASAAIASATGVHYDPTTNTWVCGIPNGVYCAGDSLGTNIIIRCNGTVGQPGNCNDNLAGQPPVGVQPAQCYEPKHGVAACVKNCVVYGGSGNIDGEFTLPADKCTPTYTSTSAEPTTTSTYVNPPTSTDEPEPTTTSTYVNPPTSTDEPEPTTTSTYINPPTSTDEPVEPTTTSTYINPPTGTGVTPVTVYITVCSTTPIPPTTITNGTTPPTVTNTPIGPSSSSIVPNPNSANGNKAGFGLAIIALAVAYLI